LLLYNSQNISYKEIRDEDKTGGDFAKAKELGLEPENDSLPTISITASFMLSGSSVRPQPLVIAPLSLKLSPVCPQRRQRMELFPLQSDRHVKSCPYFPVVPFWKKTTPSRGRG
jgi:hypothetical protein